MKPLTILEFLLLVAVFGVAKGFLEDTEFQVLIKDRCYNRTNDHKRLINGQFTPLSNSMETFIDMLEEFERNHTDRTPMNIIELFLKRFRIDGIREPQEDRFTQRLRDKSRLNLIEELLRPTAKLSDFPEDAFDEQKKCALYYMLSHTVTTTNEHHLFPTKSPEDMNSKTWIEQGVVTLNNNPVHSIALGKVLLGILAGFKNYKDRSVKELLKAVKSNKPIEFKKEPEQLNGLINPLYGVTIGDTIAAEVLRSVNESLGRVRKFGPNGRWNSTICPTKYILNSAATDATYAEIRGAGDGFILGLQVAKLKEKSVQIPISTLLRMYYSPRGIPSTSTYSYCRRWDNWGEFSDKGQEQIHFYSRLMNIYLGGGTYADHELRQGAADAMSEFENSKDDIVGSIIQKPESCFDVDSDREPTCETPSDVFVVIDNRGIDPAVWERQKNAIALLSTNLDLRYYGGRFNIFSNSRGDIDRSLEPLLVNGTSLSCIGCKLDWYLSSMTNVDETYVLESLYKMLKQYESDRAASSGVPGKSIVYFNFGDFIINEDRNFRNAHWELTNKHRDVQIFAIGSNRKRLESLATDKEKVIINDDVNEIAATLKQEICESPGILQYSDCHLRRSSMDQYDLTFSGYVTPKRVQYWSMFPEFFLKSFNIKFQFSATGGDIKVCYSRNKYRLLNGGNCKETSATEPTVTYSISNPCKGKNVYNCEPFHFAIEGKDIASHDPKCIVKECKSFDQIKFMIQHEGVSCNRSAQLFSSFVLLVLSLFYLMKMNQ